MIRRDYQIFSTKKSRFLSPILHEIDSWIFDWAKKGDQKRRQAGMLSGLTGIKEKTLLVKLGLEALIARESARRLARLGGTEANIQSIPRRRPEGK